MKNTETQKHTAIARPPVVVVMGHIDHGKSTLLDYIRKTKIVESEAGGITQHMSAYEVLHTAKDEKVHKVTFIDTPGHEAFQALRVRGASVADVAVLVVSAEDGVKPQTLEALKAITEQKIPYIVAINKIDRPSANVERTRQSLAENEIYVEGYGGSVPVVAISAKTGEGVSDLLDMIFLVVELAELTANPSIAAEGIVIESNLDPKKGVSATLIIKNGTLKKGQFVAAGESLAPVRIMEDFLGKKIDEATFSSPVKIIGWDKLVKAGSMFKAYSSKNEAIEHATKEATAKKLAEKEAEAKSKAEAAKPKDSNIETVIIPLIIKADASGSLEAIIYEIGKIKVDNISLNIIEEGVGSIGEGDVRLASADKNTIILGFNTKIDTPAKNLADRDSVKINVFDIIYKLTDSLKETIKERAPKVLVDEITGTSKIIRIFSKNKDKQIIGGKVENGLLMASEMVKIMRRENEVGTGRVRGLQSQKKDTSEVKEGSEFGAMVESKIEIAPGDRLVSFKTVQK